MCKSQWTLRKNMSLQQNCSQTNCLINKILLYCTWLFTVASLILWGSHRGDYVQIAALLNARPCSLVQVFQRFRRTSCFHKQGGWQKSPLLSRYTSARLDEVTLQKRAISTICLPCSCLTLRTVPKSYLKQPDNFMTIKIYKWPSKHNRFFMIYYFRTTCFDSLESSSGPLTNRPKTI